MDRVDDTPEMKKQAEWAAPASAARLAHCSISSAISTISALYYVLEIWQVKFQSVKGYKVTKPNEGKNSKGGKCSLPNSRTLFPRLPSSILPGENNLAHAIPEHTVVYPHARNLKFCRCTHPLAMTKFRGGMNHCYFWPMYKGIKSCLPRTKVNVIHDS